MSKDIVPIIQKELAPVVDQAMALTVNVASDLPPAVELLSRLNKFNDRLIEEREKITKPLNEALRVERGRWKPAELANQQAIEYLRNQMSVYQTKQIALQKAREQVIADKLSAGKINLDEAVKKFEKVKTPVSNIATLAGDVQFAEVKKFEVMDVIMLPTEYLLADEVKIRAKMKEGVELPGVRYWTEQQPRNYR